MNCRIIRDHDLVVNQVSGLAAVFSELGRLATDLGEDGDYDGIAQTLGNRLQIRQQIKNLLASEIVEKTLWHPGHIGSLLQLDFALGYFDRLEWFCGIGCKTQSWRTVIAAKVGLTHVRFSVRRHDLQAAVVFRDDLRRFKYRRQQITLRETAAG